MSIFEPVRRIKGFGLYLIGNGLSIFGTGLWCAVMFWFVWRHTNSAPALGLVAATTAAPLLLCAVGGVTADHYDRRGVLMLTQVIALLVAAVFAAITLAGYFNLWVVLALNATNSLITAFEYPARNAFKADIAGTTMTARVNSLYSAVDTTAFVSGGAVAGGLIALFPVNAESICAVINTISFLGALFALTVIHPLQSQGTPSGGALAPTIRDCLTFAVKDTRVLALLLQVIIVALFLGQVGPLFPTYASQIFNEGRISGLLLFTFQVAAIAGSLMSGHIRDQITWAWRLLWLLPITLASFALAPNLVVSFFALAATGVLHSMQNTSNNSSILTIASREMIGRISGWRASFHWAITLVAAPIVAYAAGNYGTRLAFLGCAIGCLAACIVLNWGLKSSTLRQ